jgi:hypothetical protein
MYTTVGVGRKRGQSVIEERNGGNEKMRVGGGGGKGLYCMKKGAEKEFS